MSTAIEQTFNYNKSGSTPVVISKTFNLFSKSAQCSTFSAGFDVDVTASVNANINYGFALSGTLIPPEVNDFSLVAGFDATLLGKLSLELVANVCVSVLL